MKKFAIIITSILFCYSCNTEEQKSLTTDSIEMTYYNGWSGGVSLKIKRNGIINYNVYDIHGKTNDVNFFKDTLTNQMLDSINLFLSAVRNEKIDSLYDGHCQDCGVYIFLISYPDTIIESMIIGTNDFNNNLTKLARFLLKKKPDAANRIDTCADFKTTKYLKPPPPPQPIKYREFIPPEENKIKREDN